MLGQNLRRRLNRVLRRDDAATDPILVIAAIAVSLVLLVGGSFAVSGIIANAKDLNAQSDLDKVATAEAALSSSGASSYANWGITAAGAVSGDVVDTSGDLLNSGQVGFTPTPGDAIKVNADANGWVAAVLSTTGKVFYRSSQASTVYPNSIPAGAYDASLTAPTVAPPYNAVGDCAPTPNPSGGAIGPAMGTDSFTSRSASAVDANTVTYTLTGTGQSFCLWAENGGFNLGGDTITGDTTQYMSFDSMNSDGSWLGTTSLSAVSAVLTAAGTDISAQRTMTITFKVSDSNGTSTADLADNMQNHGINFRFSSTTGSNIQYVWTAS